MTDSKIENAESEIRDKAKLARINSDKRILLKASKGEKLSAFESKRFQELSGDVEEREVTLDELGRWLGVERQYIHRLKKQGIIVSGGMGKYPLRQNITRAFRMTVDKSNSTVDDEIKQNQARLSHAKATMQEMKMLQAAQKLVPVGIVEKVNDRYWAAIRSSLDGVPSSAAKEANHIDPLQAELAIQKALDACFEQAEKSFVIIASEIEHEARQAMDTMWREVAEDAKKEMTEEEVKPEPDEKPKPRKRGRPKKK